MILSNINIKFQHKINTKNKSEMVQMLYSESFINDSYQQAMKMVHNMHYVDAEPETVIKDLSRISLNVLITCKKVAEKAA